MEEQLSPTREVVFSWAYDFEEEDLVQTFACLMSQNAMSSRARIILFSVCVIIPLVLTVVGVVAVLAGNHNDIRPVAISAGVALFGGWILWKNRSPEVRARNATKRPALQHSLPEVLQRTEMTLTRKGMTVGNRNTKSEFNWDAILGIAIGKDHIHFMTSPQQAFSLPRRAIADHERGALSGFLQEQVNGPIVDFQHGESISWTDVDRKTGEIITDRPHCKQCRQVKEETQLRPVWWFLQPFHGQHLYCASCRPAANRKEAKTFLISFAILAAILALSVFTGEQ